MKKDYKKLWKKLKEIINDDWNLCNSAELKARNDYQYHDALEYYHTRITYDFILKTMEELEGKQNHNIFSFKKDKSC